MAGQDWYRGVKRFGVIASSQWVAKRFDRIAIGVFTLYKDRDLQGIIDLDSGG